MVGKTAFSGESAQHLLRSVFVVMPLGFSPAANLLPPLLKRMLETRQLTRRTTWPIKCQSLVKPNFGKRPSYRTSSCR